MVLKTKHTNVIKFKATTLVEVLVASVISAITFAIGLLIYTNILHSNRSMLNSDIDLLISQEFNKTIQTSNFKSSTISYNNIEIEKNIRFYQKQEDLVLISYKAINSKSKIILEKNYLRYVGK